MKVELVEKSKEVSAYPRDLRELIDGYLKQLQFGSEPGTEGLKDAIRYSLFAGGKRIRPVMTLATARSLALEVENVLPTAAAIELVHTNSLIVDDLPAMDGREKRRGRPALHTEFGEDIALLAGAAMGSEATSLVLERQPGPPETVLALARELAHATGTEGMVGGQYLDITGQTNNDKSLRRVHELKTGSLIAASVRCALLISGMDGPAAGSYRRFAKELGVLYQIIDDILDVIGTEETLGKEPGTDKALGKITYVSFFGLERARQLAIESHLAARMALDHIDHYVRGDVTGLEQLTDYIYTRTC